MKTLKLILIIVLVIGVIVFAALGVGVWYVNRYVQTPEFKRQLLGLASRATGTQVQLNGLTVSIFKGIDLQGVAVANPSDFQGDLLTAKAFTLHYRLWPLFQKHVEIETLTFDTPVINLVRNAKGEWNYNRIGEHGSAATTKVNPAESTPATEPTAQPTTGSPPSINIGGLEISLSNVRMNNASVTMATDAGQEILKVQNASFASTVTLAGSQLSADGTATIELVNLSNALFLRGLATPVNVTATAVKLGPFTGKVADGDISGEAGLSLAGDSRYTASLQIKNADVVKLISEAGVGQPVFSGGKLQIMTSLTGTGGVDTLVGSGKIEITGGQLADIPILNLVASLLQISVLQNLKFDECLIQYTISNNVIETPVISLKSPQVQIAGTGTVTLANNKLNHNFTLTLAKGVLDHTPNEVRQEFTAHDDGSYSIDFKVWGPYSSPKTDLQKRLLQGVGNQLLKQFLK